MLSVVTNTPNFFLRQFVVATSCFNVPCHVTPLHNLRSPTFALTPFGWLLSIMLTTYFDLNIIFDLRLFFTPTFARKQTGHKTRVGCNCIFQIAFWDVALRSLVET